MFASDTVKDDAPRHHPEDVSDIDSNASINGCDKIDDDFEIPGTGPNDMPFFKTSTTLTGSYQTVYLPLPVRSLCAHPD